jgi:hypothetical protein
MHNAVIADNNQFHNQTLHNSTRSRFKIAALATVFTVIAGIFTLTPTPAHAAVDPAAFDPGYIISDAEFFNFNSLDANQIQSFLKNKVPTCATGIVCLAEYKINTTSRAATANCQAYTGVNNERASTIIKKVAVACGISPKVLLVMLEKEQSLVSSKAPTALKYKIAMGYGCPDTAACDQKYYGFANQVYNAASQFKSYGRNPTGYKHKIGKTTVLYNPKASCGSSTVNIRNQATVNLYNYTPYQPNAAAMKNINGTGDSCSAYGNRNFWVFYNNWFGSPVGNITPVGTVDSVKATVGNINIQGWAYDPETSSAPIEIHVYVNNEGTAAKTTVNRSDVNNVYRITGDHGFNINIPLNSGGNKNVCIYAINTGPGAHNLMKCVDVTLPSGSPTGVLDSVVAGKGTVLVEGWSYDPDTIASNQVHVYVDNSGTALVADKNRSDIAAAFPSYGAKHGFSTNIVASAGKHNVCAYGINKAGTGGNALLGCKTVTVK